MPLICHEKCILELPLFFHVLLFQKLYPSSERTQSLTVQKIEVVLRLELKQDKNFY